MSKVRITEQYLEDIGDAIREKTEEEKTYAPAEMADAVRNISAGGGDDLSQYAKLNAANTFTGYNTFNGTVKFSDTVRISDGVGVVWDNALNVFVPEPTQGSCAATKKYVDDTVADMDIDTSNLAKLDRNNEFNGKNTFTDTVYFDAPSSISTIVSFIREIAIQRNANKTGLIVGRATTGSTYNSISFTEDVALRILGTPSNIYDVVHKGYVDNAVANIKFNKITKNIILSAASWTNSQYTISDSDIKKDSVILFDVVTGSTQENLKALSDAQIISSSQTNGTLILQAYGTVPTVDVSITLNIL